VCVFVCVRVFACVYMHVTAFLIYSGAESDKLLLPYTCLSNTYRVSIMFSEEYGNFFYVSANAFTTAANK